MVRVNSSTLKDLSVEWWNAFSVDCSWLQINNMSWMAKVKSKNFNKLCIIVDKVSLAAFKKNKKGKTG